MIKKNTPISLVSNANLNSAFKQAFLLHQSGELERARQEYQRILQISPVHFDALHLSGVIALQTGNPGLACDWIQKAIAVNPSLPNAHYNLGMACKALNRLEDALQSFEAALERQPRYHEALSNKGVVLQELNRLPEALQAFEQAIALAPQYAEAHNSMGVVFKIQQRLPQALQCFDRAIAFKPTLAEAHRNRATIMQELGKLPEALYSIGQALTHRSSHEFLTGTGLYLLMKMCQWNGFDACLQGITADIEQGKKAMQPFAFMSLVDSPQLHLKCAQIFASTCLPQALIENTPAFHREIRKKIRIAYYSADFHNHATTHLMVELLEHHDKDKFEVYGFSFGPQRKDAMHHRIARTFDRFLEVQDLSDAEIGETSRSLGIDIAIDLKGYTTDARPGVFAHRCAPIQVNYLGYPGTMGVSCFEYILADKVVLPEEHLPYCIEKPVYLPDCYQCNDSQRRIAETVGARTDYGLPAEGFVYCCFNNNHKILPAVFDIWLRILQAVPGSVLWLLEDNPWVVQNLRQYAQARQVAPERLVFAPRMPIEDHLARHRFADLFLDTWPYNAHTTASDALWAGVPVLTFAGQSFPARVAASLLHAVGLPDLVTTDWQDYERMAREFGLHPEKVEGLKRRLADHRMSASLFDGKRMARNIERAYEEMIQRLDKGLGPAIIDLSLPA